MHVGAATAAVIAAAGLVVGIGGLALAWASWLKISRTRDAQKHVLGGTRRDVIDFAVSLQTRIDDLHRTVDEIAAGLARLDRRIDQGLTNVAVVRYDAYEDTGGHQSASVAMWKMRSGRAIRRAGALRRPCRAARRSRPARR